MKNILVVIDDLNTARTLLSKAMSLKPDAITLLLFNANEQESLQQQFDSLKTSLAYKGSCQVNQSPDSKDKAESIISTATDIHADVVVLNKPNLIEHPSQIDFIKTLVRGVKRAKLLFCRNKKWKTSLNLLCTLDLNDDSGSQRELNVAAFNYANKTLAPRLNAKMHLGTIISVSRVGEELDVIEPSEVLTEKGAMYREKMVQFERQQGTEGALLHVGAGVPAKELPSLASRVKSDLVVMGNVGRKGLKGLIIGNTAEKIFRNLNSDVLLLSQ